ncbi:MAG: ammonia-forming cytochrome c nitrite reductase [Cyclonatronaceae bacterium]
MKTLGKRIEEKPWIGWVVFLITVVVVFLAGLFTYTIVERRTEAQFVFQPVKDLHPLEPRLEKWGEAFPRQFNTYNQMADTTFRSEFLGSTRMDLLEKYPGMVILFAGYAFSADYNLARGHYYSVTDIRETLRTGAPMEAGEGPMPATCWTCKSADVPRVMTEMGTDEYYAARWSDLGHEIVNPIGCVNCHDSETMNLRISQPALVEAFERRGQDVTEASHQEMRSLTCAQCHVEYYFGPGNRLIFPWDEGLHADEVEKYVDNIEFADWVHPLSRTPMIKAQHPDYEIYKLGIHARRGVSCADCHMPYRTEGGVKYTDHRVQSPLNNVANACQTCHRQSEEELTRNVVTRQRDVYEVRDKLESALVKAHLEAEFAWNLGADEEQMAPVLQHIRRGQWRWDYGAASHGGPFHAPQEMMKMFGIGLDHAQEARIELARIVAQMGHTEPIPLPDVSTKAKAQEYVGIDLDSRQSEKNEFLRTVVPEWLQRAEERHQEWDAGESEIVRTR